MEPTLDTAVVVTGAARGIGRGIAERMVARGHRVVVTDVDGAGASRTAEEIGAAAAMAHDVRDPAAHTAVAEAATGLGPVVAWFNNAGVAHDGECTALTDDQVRALVEVNLLGVVWGCRAAVAAFGPAGGDIVNTASLSGLGPAPGLAVYGATKAAVVSLSMSLDVETPAAVRVHALCPDGVDTAMVSGMAHGGLARALVNSGGSLLGVDGVADAAVELVGSRRVVRTLPAWRGAAMRLGSLTPSSARPLYGVFAAQGRRAMRKG